MKLTPRQRVLPALIACLLSVGAAHAADPSSSFTVSGFATLGLVKTDTDLAQYAIAGQTRGADKDISAEVDSKLGLQFGAKFNNMFSGTVQLLTKSGGDGNFKPGVEWAFVKAQLAPSVAVRLGRMGAPFFAISDFRAVGFANTTLRPPQDVYSQVPVSHFDGADASYQANLGVGTLTLQGFGGKSAEKFERVDVELDRLYGINATLETDAGLTLRFGHASGKLTVKSTSLAGLVSTLRATPFASVGNQLDANDKKASFTGVGLTWDEGQWLVNAEYTQRRVATYLPDTDGWYVTVGRRIGSWTPYASASQIKSVSTNVNNTVVAATPQLAQLRGIVDATLASQQLNQKTLAIGTRWDFARNFAMKVQLDHVRPQGDAFFVQIQPGFNSRKVNVFSIAVDTVF